MRLVEFFLGESMSREDWLEQQLEKDTLPDDLRAKYEAELDRIAGSYEDMKTGTDRPEEDPDPAVQRKQLSPELQRLRQQLIDKDPGAMHSELAKKLAEDYTVEEHEDGEWIVISAVAPLHMQDRHIFPTEEKAISYVHALVWQRMYGYLVKGGREGRVGDVRGDVRSVFSKAADEG